MPNRRGRDRDSPAKPVSFALAKGTGMTGAIVVGAGCARRVFRYADVVLAAGAPATPGRCGAR